MSGGAATVVVVSNAGVAAVHAVALIGAAIIVGASRSCRNIMMSHTYRYAHIAIYPLSCVAVVSSQIIILIQTRRSGSSATDIFGPNRWNITFFVIQFYLSVITEL